MPLTKEQRERVVKEAKSWIGTPYVGWSCVKGVGVDCGQLLAGVYIGAGFFKKDEMLLPEYYSLSVAQHKESTEYVEQIMRFMREIPECDVQPGDVIVYKLGLAFAHAAIAIDYPSYVIHAFAHGGVRGASGDKHPRLKRTSRKYFTLKDEFCVEPVSPITEALKEEPRQEKKEEVTE